MDGYSIGRFWYIAWVERPYRVAGKAAAFSAGKREAGARLDAHVELRAKRLRLARDALYRNRPFLGTRRGFKLHFNDIARSNICLALVRGSAGSEQPDDISGCRAGVCTRPLLSSTCVVADTKHPLESP